MSEHFFDEQDEDENKKKFYVNFKPVWNESLGWVLHSVKTGKTYCPSQLVGTHFNEKYRGKLKLKPIFDGYMPNLLEESFCSLTPRFMFHWLKLMTMYEAMDFRETKRSEYLANNLVPDMPAKAMGKVYKKSEQVYTDSYEEFFDRFKEL